MEPSEQAVPFFDEAAVDAVLVARYGYAGPWPGRRAAIQRDLTAALKALSPRSKAILELARLSDEELVERVNVGFVEAGLGQTVPWQRRAVLAALGLPVDEQTP